MIFQHTWASVIDRSKTQTRRVIKPGEQAVRGRHNRIQAIKYNGRIKWEVGRTYAVQIGRGTAQVARIRIVRIRSEYLSRISSAEALAEGFPSRQDFLRVWKLIHGPLSTRVRVWVLEFELVAVYTGLTTSAFSVQAGEQAWSLKT